MESKLVELRWHGRGGQGAKTAAMLFAETAIEDGKYGQGFPDYGPERMGAPIQGFNRISDSPIRIHCQIENPDVVIVLDPTLMSVVDVTNGIKEDGIVIINTPLSPADIRKILKLEGRTIYTLNATQIALDTIGRPIPNTVMMGAIIKATGLISMDTMIHDMEKKFLKKYNKKVAEANVQAIKRAVEEVVSE
jgi:pyruvate ferredoxin oxidoreductase gamma subunit